MFKDIFTFEDNIDGNEDFVEYGGVTFLKDFGPFKAHDNIIGLNISIKDAVFQEVDGYGEPLERKCSFVLTPVTA